MLKKALLAALLATMAGGSYAESPGFYLGAGVGVWNIDVDQTEETGMSARANAGFKFCRFFALEGSYVYLDEVEEDGGNLSLDGRGWELSARPSFPFTESFEGYARLGFARYDIEGQSDRFVSIEDGSDDYLVVALGAAWSPTDHFSLFGDYSELHANDTDANIYIMTFGVTYNF